MILIFLSGRSNVVAPGCVAVLVLYIVELFLVLHIHEIFNPHPPFLLEFKQSINQSKCFDLFFLIIFMILRCFLLIIVYNEPF